MNAFAMTDRPDVGETNGLVNGQAYHDEFKNARTVDWTEKGLKITRLRLLSDPGFPVWDVSYCHGMIGNEMVYVDLPFSQLGKRTMMKDIIWYAKKDKVYAKGIGIFDALSKLC